MSKKTSQGDEMRDEYDFVAGAGGFQLSHYDDANILGFDGLFARAEITY